MRRRTLYFPLLRVENLSKSFFWKNQKLDILKNISFSIPEGQTFAVVGESGCGKSTLGRTLLRLYEPTSGKILFQGIDLTTLSKKEMKKMRKHIQMIFQDPFSSLNPRMTVREILLEPLEVHLPKEKREHQKRIDECLDFTHLPKSCLHRFPHEFSGGQRQRIGIARALALSPKFLVCDEPISSLDASIQAQIVNLLLDLQKDLKLTYLFIGHDLSMVKVLAQKIAVLHQGEFIEVASSDEIFYSPKHPLTKTLIASAFGGSH